MILPNHGEMPLEVIFIWFLTGFGLICASTGYLDGKKNGRNTQLMTN